MEGRQRLGAVLIVVGVGLVAVGGVALAGRSPTAAVPSPSAAPVTTAPAGPTGPLVTTQVSPGPTVAPTVDTLTIVRAFFEDLQANFRAGTQEDLVDSLAPDVIALYGREACAAALGAKPPVPDVAFEILDVHPPAQWDYSIDGFVIPIPNATTVDARVTGPDAAGVIGTETRELHILIIGPTVFWYTDCGEPLPIPSF